MIRMRLKKMKTTMCFLLLFLLFGCSIRTDFFIQNLSNESKVITIKYKVNLSDPQRELYVRNLNFQYAEGLYSARKFKDDVALQLLEKKVSDSLIVFVVPAKSTVRIDKSHNYSWSGIIDYVEIENIKVTLDNFRKNTEYQKGVVLYSIKEISEYNY